MSKKRFLEKIEVKTPCSEDWNEMRGNAQVRFCSHCNFNVNNLSAMTRKEALKIVRQSKGRICVRYVVNPVDNTPIFGSELYQIAKRGARLAVGVMTAALSLSSMTYAQQREPPLPKITSDPVLIKKSLEPEKDKIESVAASISGTITDPTGAVVPNVTLVLANETIGERRTTSNEDGVYEFKDLSAGVNYTLKAESAGFRQHTIENIKIGEGENSKIDISMEVGAVMGLIVVSPQYSTPLFTAVSEDNLEAVKNLIARGENVNAKDENYDNITPLFLAVENGNAEIAETLLSFGAKINARDENKQTPLMRLDEDATPELVRLLIKHGAKINAVDKNKNTALILAASGAGAEVLQVLIRHDARLNAQNNEGQTALMNAAYEDELESVRALILAGADVNLKNKEGETAWDLTGDKEIGKLLENFGAQVKENESESPANQ